jgi:hypothetical protein
MLGSSAVAFREAIAHAPSAASLGVYAALHMRVNSKKWDVGIYHEVVYRAVVVGERRGARIANLRTAMS